MTTQNTTSTNVRKRKPFGLGFKEWLFLLGLVMLFIGAAVIEPLTIYAVNQLFKH